MSGPIRILAWCGSMRAASLNRLLMRHTAAVLGARAEITEAEMRDHVMPLYDGDLEARDGPPPAALALKERIVAADALLLVTPEYNNSVPGVVKNAIDWLSRGPAQPFRGRPVLLATASPGAFGGVRCQMALRIVFATLGAHLYPTCITLPHADQAFDADGALKEPRARKQVERTCEEFLTFVARLKTE